MSKLKIAMISSEIGNQVVGSYDKQIVVKGTERFFDRILFAAGKISSKINSVETLDIYAHCVGTVISEWKEKTSRFYGLLTNLNPDINDGGGLGAYGAKIGSDWITSRTVKKWEEHASIFTSPCWINFRVCMMARQSPDHLGQQGVYSGDGIALCKEIAIATGAYVRASSTPQLYEETGLGLSFRPWRGPVFLFSPEGDYWLD